jgi:phage terminase large subunit GpA-like protein
MNEKSYDNYLKTAIWRARRNRALKQALWTCERCGGRRELQVHHKTYERLGAERDEDLEVLCDTCHRGHHRTELHDHEQSRVYLKIASDALEANPWATVADIAEEVKTQCARLRLPYRTHEADKAINVLTGANRFKRGLPTTPQEFHEREGRPLTHQESVEILTRLGLL